MALCFAAGWLFLGRAFTGRTLTACFYVAVASTLAAAAALVAARILARRHWSARFAAAVILLVVGVGGLTPIFMAMQMAWAFHDLSELPLHIFVLVLALMGAAALYNFLAIAGLLILPLGLPAIALFAVLIARTTR